MMTGYKPTTNLGEPAPQNDHHLVVVVAFNQHPSPFFFHQVVWGKDEAG